MNWLEELISSFAYHPSTLIWLLETFAKTALILLAALLLTRFMRRGSASTRHQVWAWALIATLALPALSAILPDWDTSLLSVEIDASVLATATPKTATPKTATPLDSGPIADSGHQSHGVIPERARQAISAAEPKTQSISDTATARLSLVGLWLIGMSILLARLLTSSAAAWWLARHSDSITDPDFLDDVAQAQDQLGITHQVTVALSSRISMPMAWGVLRSTVLLPSEATSWTSDKRRVVLLHEMAHLERRDCQTLLLARLVTAVHWFNPLAWLATRQVQIERERACDDLVLTSGTKGSDYAAHLLEIARSMTPRIGTPTWASVAMARPNELEGRLLAILDPELNRNPTPRVASFTGWLTVGLLVLPLASIQPFAFADETPAGSTAKSEEMEASSRDTNSRVIDVLTKSLRDESSAIRSQAAHSLGRIGAVGSAAALAETLRSDHDSQVRQQAAWALGMIEHDSAVPVLITSLSDAKAAVREEAAWALGMIESAEAVEALITVLEQETSDVVRQQAAWALGMIESPKSTDALIAVLGREPSDDVREQAAWALGMIGDKVALDALLDAVADTSPAVREQAFWAIGQVTG